MTLSLNFVLQIGISIFLILGVILVKRLSFIKHGYLMFLAVAFNLFSLVFLMFPSALKILSGASLNYFIVLVA